MNTKRLLSLILFFSFASVLLPLGVLADTFEQGGSAEKFGGGGDQDPPSCRFEIPSASTEPFFAEWDCIDNNPEDTTRDQIRTALWIQRADDTRFRLVDRFLGFPASVQVDRALLKVDETAEFNTGLPVQFRLEASDRAGNTTISPIYTVFRSALLFDTCQLSLIAEGTESIGGTTGLPAASVVVSDAAATSSNLSTSSVQIQSTEAALAEPCELNSVCANGSEVTFSAVLNIESSGDTSGTLTVSPGNVALNVTGETTLANAVAENVEVDGSLTIDSRETTVSLTCVR